jgi:hypothetical protein
MGTSFGGGGGSGASGASGGGLGAGGLGGGGLGAGGLGAGGLGAGGLGAGGLGGAGVTGGRAQAIALATAFPTAAPTATTIRTDLQQIIQSSTRLPSRANISVLSNGTGVVLRGTVATEHERLLAEALVRLTPGVRDIANELEVRGSAPSRSP